MNEQYKEPPKLHGSGSTQSWIQDDGITPWGGFPPEAWALDSMAVLSSDGNDGIVMFTAGPHLALEIEDYGNCTLLELGFEDVPRGIWIWQGRIIWDKEGEPVDQIGHIREPLDSEWKAIRERRNPWNDADWGRNVEIENVSEVCEQKQ
jgi:hypothetical protein